MLCLPSLPASFPAGAGSYLCWKREGAGRNRRPLGESGEQLLLEEEGVQVSARVGGLEQVATDAGSNELTLVAVVVSSPRRVVVRDLHVEVAVRLVPLVPGELLGSCHLLVDARDVEVREVVVVRIVDVVAVQKNVDEVVRIRVVLVPADEHGVEVR